MTKKERIVTETDALTGKTIVRPFNDEENAQADIDEILFIARQAEAQAIIEAKALAQSKLTALGLTIDDLKALGL